MIYANVEMINVLIAEKRYKPLIIENVVIEAAGQPSMWRKKYATILRELAELLESPRTSILKTA